MKSIFQDFRFACKIGKSAPLTATLAVGSLALAIAASTTVFSVVYTVLLGSPSFKNANRVVVIWESSPKRGISKTPVAAATFRDWKQNSRTLEALELVAPGSPVTISSSGVPERANLQYASPGLFRLLGVQPIVGRTFFESDVTSSDAPVLLGYGLRERRYGHDASVIGRKIIVNGEVRTISGILPKEFHLFDRDTDIWMPIALPDARSQDRSFRSWLIAVGRLRPHETVATAQAEMRVLCRQIAAVYPASNNDWTAKVERVQDAEFGTWKGILYPLWGAVTLVLLISCVNVANLFLGRLTARAREISIRAALGAERRRLIIQLLNEGLLVGLVGGLLGCLLSEWGIRLFQAVAPSDFPLLHSVQLNGIVLLFCFFVAVLSGALLGVVPAFVGTKVNLSTALRQASRSSMGQRKGGFQNAFAVVQIALSVALLLGTGLMVRSLVSVLRVDTGFRTEHVVTMQIFLSGPRYFVWRPDGVRIEDEVNGFYSRLLERVQAIPEVHSSTVVSWLPEMGYNTGNRERTFRLIGQGAGQHVAYFNAVSDGYFSSLRIPMLQGRSFQRNDNPTGPWVVIVNKAFAERYFPGGSALGKEIAITGSPREKLRQIVGVVANVHQDSPERSPEPEIFTPYQQQPPFATGHGYQNRVHMNLVVNASDNPGSTVAAIRKVAAQLDPNQPVYGVRTMATVVSEATALRRMYATVLEIFAGFALFLSTISLYGVASQSVVERTAEIGLRMALGATAKHIHRLFLLQSSKLILWGLASGIVTGFFASRVLSSFLFGVSVYDPLTLIAVCGLLLAACFLAVWFPTRRVTRIDPNIALHEE